MNSNLVKKVIAPLTAIVIGVIFICVSVSNIKKISAYPQTEAVISRVDVEYNAADEQDDITVYVTYTVDGKSYESELSQSSSAMKEGDKLTVSYNPDKPAEVIASSKTMSRVFLAIGCVVGVVGLGLLAKNLLIPFIAARKAG